MTDATTTIYAGAPMSDNVQVIESLLASLPRWVEVVRGRSDLLDEQTVMQILTSALIQDVSQLVSGQDLAAFAQNLATMVRWARRVVQVCWSSVRRWDYEQRVLDRDLGGGR